MIALIAAVDDCFGIGKNNQIPWYLSSDLKRFKALTQNSSIIMGRKTWESIGSKPLKNRLNIIVSKTLSKENNNGFMIVDNVEQAFTEASSHNPHVFFIGGQEIYRQGLKYADTIFLTNVAGDYQCDTFFPIEEMEKDFQFHNSTTNMIENGIKYDFLEFIRRDEAKKL